jgi:hypothetical protein
MIQLLAELPPFPELHDITPPVEPMDPVARGILIAQIAFSALAVAATLYVLWRTLRRGLVPPPVPLSPQTIALRDLNALEAQAGKLPSAELALALADTVRVYLQRAHGILSRVRTTDELFPRRTEDTPPPLPHLAPFEFVLRQADAWRFAQTDPTPEERVRVIQHLGHVIHHGTAPPQVWERAAIVAPEPSAPPVSVAASEPTETALAIDPASELPAPLAPPAAPKAPVYFEVPAPGSLEIR